MESERHPTKSLTTHSKEFKYCFRLPYLSWFNSPCIQHYHNHLTWGLSGIRLSVLCTTLLSSMFLEVAEGGGAMVVQQGEHSLLVLSHEDPGSVSNFSCFWFLDFEPNWPKVTNRLNCTLPLFGGIQSSLSNQVAAVSTSTVTCCHVSVFLELFFMHMDQPSISYFFPFETYSNISILCLLKSKHIMSSSVLGWLSIFVLLFEGLSRCTNTDDSQLE